MLWILLTLIYVRPFISSLAFPYANLIHSGLLLIVLFLWLRGRRCAHQRLSLLAAPLVIFAAGLCASLVFSQQPLVSIKGCYPYATGILLFWAMLALSEKEQAAVVDALSGAAVVIALLAIYQYLFGFGRLQEYVRRQGISDGFTLEALQRRRVFFPFVTPNTLGAYLAMMLPLVATRRRRLLYLPCVAIALLFTRSLGAIASLCAAAGIYGLLRKNANRKIIIAVGIGIVALAVTALLRSVAAPAHTHPFFSALMRLNYWQETIKIIAAAPLTGVGIGNFNLTLSRYSHNAYLQLWAETGIVALAGFLWLIGRILRSVWRSYRGQPLDTMRTACLMAVVTFLVNNCVDFSFFLPEVSLIWWCSAGLLFARLTLTSPPSLSPGTTAPAKASIDSQG